MLKIETKNRSSGAVSLFVVVFTALLITVVTVSFVRIMVQEQQQASSVDLSQSAYDSAQAGVEDGKRALLRYESACSVGPSSSACVEATTQINSTECNGALSALEDIDLENGEVPIETGDSNNLDQAYTCVKINLDTNDYIGSLEADQSKIIPLDPGESGFDRVRVEWFSVRDLSSQDSLEVDLQSSASSGGNLFPAQADWSGESPPVMRSQFMQVGNVFKLSDFDASTGNNTNKSNANTVFLYPTGRSGEPSNAIDSVSIASSDIRQVPSGSPVPVTCSGDLSAGGYACRVNLDLPSPMRGSSGKTAFLRLTSLYNKAHFRVSLYDGDTLVRLNGVQPEIDSTGRANDLFRRVQTRIEMFNNRFPFPEAAVDLTGDFCKDFMVTQNADDYTRNSSCEP